MFRKLKVLYDKLLMLDDTPHRIAWGMAIGLFIAWTPTVGIQTLIVLPIAWLAGGNRMAGVIGIYLSNPITFLPMYWLEFSVGALVLRDPLTYNEFRAMLAAADTNNWWQTLAGLGSEVIVPMFLGGVILGAANAVAGYFFTHWLVRRVRRTGRGLLGRKADVPIPSGSAGRTDVAA